MKETIRNSKGQFNSESKAFSGEKHSEETKKNHSSFMKNYYKNNIHPSLGKQNKWGKHTEKSKKIMSEKMKEIALSQINDGTRKGTFSIGHEVPQEWRIRSRENNFINAKINPNYGMKGKYHSEESKKIMSEHNGMHKPEVRKKVSDILKKGYSSGRILLNSGIWKKGNIPWSKGKTKKDEPKLSNSGVKKGNISWNKGKLMPEFSGEKNPNWNGGSSFEPYGKDFNKRLKEKTRKKYKHTCQECHFTQEKLGYKLPIHHIDYDKRNNSENNLIPLCRNCHAQTIFGRNQWQNYLQGKVLQ